METKWGQQAVKVLIESPRHCNDGWFNDLTLLLDGYIYISTEKQVTSRKPKASSQKHPNRGKVLQAGVEWLVHQRELQRQARSDNRQRKVTLQPLHVKHDMNMKVNTDKEWMTPYIIHVFCHKQCALLLKSNWYALSLCGEGTSTVNWRHFQLFKQKQPAGFQQATVSSQLRVNHPPQKEHSVPWKPTSPHSPPLQRLEFYFCKHQILWNLICTLNKLWITQQTLCRVTCCIWVELVPQDNLRYDANQSKICSKLIFTLNNVKTVN